MKTFHFSNPITAKELQLAYKNGLIAKKDLKDRQTYTGHCRNASSAVWVAEANIFVYRRHKFGVSFLESINHPEDDNGFDIFPPESETMASITEEELNKFLDSKKG